MNFYEQCHVYDNDEVKTLDNFLHENKNTMKPSFFGLEKLDMFDNCFVMYYDFSEKTLLPPRGFKGISVDKNRDIVLSVIPKSVSPVAILHYKK